jgi:hypothetical protein
MNEIGGAALGAAHEAGLVAAVERRGAFSSGWHKKTADGLEKALKMGSGPGVSGGPRIKRDLALAGAGRVSR